MDPYASAKAILPFVFDKWVKTPNFAPAVLDVGCGDGGWLRAAKEFGAYTVGLDYPAREVEGVDTFHEVDLHRMLKQSWWNELEGERYDFAICLEVAEHLPEACGARLVDFLCSLSPVILFSAAHPGQGPYPPPDATPENIGCWHINEQPLSYWADQFRACGFKQLDVVRPRFAQDIRVDPWYRTNTCLYVEDDR